ncbi:cystathionine gamma-synthase [Enemella dayhoffiae]|uniref:Cystathionine gamma-synthase n=1 Tax=Enemella dayhoffiae TaxID=2016507 RepID=A0A255GRC6_9ACTN|nr:PLP-dependent aspartate aminotransferase family protein [Enemella dayhoffiae]OYO18370.1 cystathionine gamma-synthase [Enemella dayhoffiae]
MADDFAQLAPETLAVVGGRPERTPGSPVGPGIELSSTYLQPGDIDPQLPLYGRNHNATWAGLEAVVGGLEGAADGAVSFASGMAAGTALLELIPRGARLAIGATSYNTMLALAQQRAERGDLVLSTVDVADLAAVRAVLGEVDWLHLESPTNPLLEVADLPAICAAARAAGVRVSVDNTFATPLLQNPLAAGADVVLHSATKYLAGHSDVLLGVLVTRDAGLLEAIRSHRTLTGGIPGPFEAWLALRGVRTLAVRLDRAQQSAAVLAGRLAGHPAVRRVRYPGLESDPGHEVATRTMRGFGAMVAIELADQASADALTRAVRLWIPATSLGGVESLLERRRRIPSEPPGVPQSLVRLSVGLEDVEDLWTDLERALARD